LVADHSAEQADQDQRQDHRLWPPCDLSARGARYLQNSFAKLKTRFNLRRLSLRGLRWACEQFLLVATAQNLKRLVKHASNRGQTPLDKEQRGGPRITDPRNQTGRNPFARIADLSNSFPEIPYTRLRTSPRMCSLADELGFASQPLPSPRDAVGEEFRPSRREYESRRCPGQKRCRIEGFIQPLCAIHYGSMAT
jgi:hypothetical protein